MKLGASCLFLFWCDEFVNRTFINIVNWMSTHVLTVLYTVNIMTIHIVSNPKCKHRSYSLEIAFSWARELQTSLIFAEINLLIVTNFQECVFSAMNTWKCFQGSIYTVPCNFPISYFCLNFIEALKFLTTPKWVLSISYTCSLNISFLLQGLRKLLCYSVLKLFP